MNGTGSSTQSRRAQSSGLPIAVVFGAFAILTGVAHAAEPAQEIAITGTRVERIPYDITVRRPAKEVTVTASIPADLSALTLSSGVALLENSVRDAALKACVEADPRASATSDVTIDCVNRAVREARPQIEALVARARSVAKS